MQINHSSVPVDFKSDDMNVITLSKVQEVCKDDPTISQLVEMIYRGFPSHLMPKNLKPYHQFRHNLHVVNQVPCYKDRVVIPEGLRIQVIESVRPCSTTGCHWDVKLDVLDRNNN